MFGAHRCAHIVEDAPHQITVHIGGFCQCRVPRVLRLLAADVQDGRTVDGLQLADASRQLETLAEQGDKTRVDIVYLPPQTPEIVAHRSTISTRWNSFVSV